MGFNGYFPHFVGPSSFLRPVRAALPALCWAASWWFAPPGWEPGFLNLAPLSHIMSKPLTFALKAFCNWLGSLFLVLFRTSMGSLLSGILSVWATLSFFSSLKKWISERAGSHYTALLAATAVNITLVSPCAPLCGN